MLPLLTLVIQTVRFEENTPMQVRWKILLVKITVWLSLEIWLNLVGLDYLADYSEFIFKQNNGFVGLCCLNLG